MILISGLVVGLNSLVGGSLRKSTAARESAYSDFALDSSLEIGHAIILGNITLSATEPSRIVFNGSPIICNFDKDFASVLRIQDVAGLVDLRLAPDEVLTPLLQAFLKQNVTRALLVTIRENAQSGGFISADDVLIASGLTAEEAEWVSAYSTIHGRNHRLARDVTPIELQSLLEIGGAGTSQIFGASPTNATYKIETFSKSRRSRDAYSVAVVSFDQANGLTFSRIFEKRRGRRSVAGRELESFLQVKVSSGLTCSKT
jgi:hypothetical protein